MRSNTVSSTGTLLATPKVEVVSEAQRSWHLRVDRRARSYVIRDVATDMTGMESICYSAHLVSLCLVRSLDLSDVQGATVSIARFAPGCVDGVDSQVHNSFKDIKLALPKRACSSEIVLRTRLLAWSVEAEQAASHKEIGRSSTVLDNASLILEKRNVSVSYPRYMNSTAYPKSRPADVVSGLFVGEYHARVRECADVSDAGAGVRPRIYCSHRAITFSKLASIIALISSLEIELTRLEELQ